MSEPCATCGPAGKQQADEQMISILVKAKKHAEEKKIPVAIYKDPTGEWRIINAFDAYAGGYPVAKVVSFDNNPSPL